MKNVIEEMEARGFIDQMSSPDIRKLAEKPMTVYCGFDPTADSLHLGNLVAIMGLKWFEEAGHKVVAIVGGATGMIGDPSGKSQERNLLSEDVIQKNLEGIQRDLSKILKSPQVLNNFSWYKDFSFLDFLRDVGKYFRMGPMLSKDSVKSRMQSEDGMSFTEFSYQLLQGYDFGHLKKHFGVSVQIGGSDQWGNIVAGIDYIKKTTGESAYGVTFPLLTKADGQKFGKSEKGAVWLSAEKLSPYEFYQHLYRSDDRDVVKLLKILTLVPLEEIQELEKQLVSSPNAAQKRLAEEVTRLVHGESGLSQALAKTDAAKPGHETPLNREALEMLVSDFPHFDMEAKDVVGAKFIDLVAALKIQASKGDARRMIKSGGFLLNNKKVTDEAYIFQPEDLIENKFVVIGVGKKTKYLLRIK